MWNTAPRAPHPHGNDLENAQPYQGMARTEKKINNKANSFQHTMVSRAVMFSLSELLCLVSSTSTCLSVISTLCSFSSEAQGNWEWYLWALDPLTSASFAVGLDPTLSSQMLRLPSAFPCCLLYRYCHHRFRSPGKQPLCWLETTSPFFTGEVNPGKGISFNIKITESSDLLDLVCEVLLFSHLETAYCLIFLFFFEWLKPLF